MQTFSNVANIFDIYVSGHVYLLAVLHPFHSTLSRVDAPFHEVPSLVCKGYH